MSTGWAHAILRSVEKDERPLDLFFELVDEYRKLQPRVVASARLGPQNKARAWGPARPRVLQIVQYAPENFFLFRYRYASGVVFDEVVRSGAITATSLGFAMSCANQVEAMFNEPQKARGKSPRGMGAEEALPQRTLQGQATLVSGSERQRQLLSLISRFSS